MMQQELVISFNIVKGIIFSGVAFSLLNVSISFIWAMVGAIALGVGIGGIGGKFLTSGRLMSTSTLPFLRFGDRWLYSR
jgi:NhaP-type Na+/H+ or K+/H+ antiporter